MGIFLLNQTAATILLLLTGASVWDFLLSLLTKNGLWLLLLALLSENRLACLNLKLLGWRLRCRRGCLELWLSESCGSIDLLRLRCLKHRLFLHLLLLAAAALAIKLGNASCLLCFGLQAEIWSRLIRLYTLRGKIWHNFLRLLAAKHWLCRGKGIRCRHWNFCFLN